MRQAISTLKNKIGANVAESQVIRKQIHESKGLERHQLWNEKRALGSDTRYLLLALAALRGRPYASVEAKCAPGNEPSPSALLETIRAALPQDCPETEQRTREQAKAWLVRPEPAKAGSVAEGQAA